MFLRSSLTLFAVLLLAACDRGAEEGAQQQGDLPDAKGSLEAAAFGEIDRSQAGALMPAIALTDPSGAALNSAAIQGEPVLVNLWATWCAPCIKEMPLLDELAREYDGRLRVLTISQDMQGGEAVEPFFAARDFTMLQPWLDPEGAVMADIGATDLPTTVLFDASGQEVWRVTGDYDWGSEEARAALDEDIG